MRNIYGVPIRVIPQGVTGPRNPATDLRSKLAAMATPPWESSTTPRAQWFVVQSTVNSEFRAAAEVRLLNFRAYVPTETKWIRPQNRRQRAERPLFSRYFFVSFDPGESGWQAIQTARGVETLLCRTIRDNADRVDRIAPTSIASTIVDALFRAQQAGKFDRTVGAAVFAKGSNVAIEDGPFAGLMGEVANSDDKARVKILIRLFNMPTKITLDASLLRAS